MGIVSVEFDPPIAVIQLVTSMANCPGSLSSASPSLMLGGGVGPSVERAEDTEQLLVCQHHYTGSRPRLSNHVVSNSVLCGRLGNSSDRMGGIQPMARASPTCEITHKRTDGFDE